MSRHFLRKSRCALRRGLPVMASISSLLNEFHRSKADRYIKKWTPIACDHFRSGFNASGFVRLFFALPDRPSSFWGIDRCLRIWEHTGSHSSHVFHQGVFAQSIDLQKNFKIPWEDSRFHDLQTQTLNQFFSLLEFLSIDDKRLQVSYCGGCVLGGHPDGRDRLLKKKYRFPEDRVSRKFLRQRGIRCVGVPALDSIAMNGPEGTPVGVGLEVFCDDVEIGTILFHCFKIRNGILQPINYLAIYGVGLERLASVINGGNFLESVERYALARKILARKAEVARLRIYERDVLRLLYGLEALAVVPSRVSMSQKRLMQPVKLEVKRLILDLGLSFEDVKAVFSFFQHWKD
jgi:hypothetical protein